MDSSPFLQPCDQVADTNYSAKTSNFMQDPDDPSARLSNTEANDSECHNRNFYYKPLLPYVRGFTITAWQHEPPEPFGIYYKTEVPPVPHEQKSLSQLEFCLAQPPLKGHTHFEQSKTLKITSIIKTGRASGPQLVVVNNTAVAKIYDPLYYARFDEFSNIVNVVSEADGDYSREAAAYRALQSSPGARDATPTFYGTWTTEIETFVDIGNRQEVHKRHVRFILMEHLDGRHMNDISSNDFREPVRSLILKRVLEAEAIIYHAGILHQDFRLRHIVITIGSTKGIPGFEVEPVQVVVKVFDFNTSAVLNHPKCLLYSDAEQNGLLNGKADPRLPSPIVRFYQHMNEFSVPGWCPNADPDTDIWLWKHFHRDARYLPVVWDPNKPRLSPKYEEQMAEVQRGSCSTVSANSVRVAGR